MDNDPQRWRKRDCGVERGAKTLLRQSRFDGVRRHPVRFEADGSSELSMGLFEGCAETIPAQDVCFGCVVMLSLDLISSWSSQADVSRLALMCSPSSDSPRTQWCSVRSPECQTLEGTQKGDDVRLGSMPARKLYAMVAPATSLVHGRNSGFGKPNVSFSSRY